MAPPQDHVEDAQEDASSDEDFNPETQAAEVESSSSDDEEAAKGAKAPQTGTKRRRDDDTVDAGLDSGDEATIQELKKRKRRKAKGKATDEDAADYISDDEGGEGGFVRTRAQRAVEKVERRALASTIGATIDVDDVWSRLSAIPIGRIPEEVAPTENADDYVTIKRTTRFAGQVSTEEKRVLKSSQEARIWLEEQEAETAKKKKKDKENEAPADAEMQDGDASATEDGEKALKMPLRRPLKRPLRWDPNPIGEVKGLPPNLQLRWPRDKAAPSAAQAVQAPTGPAHRMLPPPVPGAAKLNTVQKSKYDWASYVDKNKLAEELDEHAKSKQSYAGRTDFLNRLESRKEEQRLQAVRKTR